jgi:hypothetical protein
MPWCSFFQTVCSCCFSFCLYREATYIRIIAQFPAFIHLFRQLIESGGIIRNKIPKTFSIECESFFAETSGTKGNLKGPT